MQNLLCKRCADIIKYRDLYCYELCSVDYFRGMTKLKDYAELCKKYENYYLNYNDYLTMEELKQFVISAFIATVHLNAGWNKDIRNNDQIYIGALPGHGHEGSSEDASLYLVFKQDNGGWGFAVSEIAKIPSIDNKESDWNRNKKCQITISRYLNLYECYDDMLRLYEKLIRN